MIFFAVKKKKMKATLCLEKSSYISTGPQLKKKSRVFYSGKIFNAGGKCYMFPVFFFFVFFCLRRKVDS